MGQIIKQIKGKAIFKHETQAIWDQSNDGQGVAYIPDFGEKVLYDPDAVHDYTRVKYGNGVDIVKNLPFADEKVDDIKILGHIEQGSAEAGCKGYYWGKYSYFENVPGYIVYLTLNSTRPPVGSNTNGTVIDPSILNWQVGDRVSIANQSGEKFPTCTIASIDGATVGVNFSGTVGTDATKYQRDDDRTIFNIDKPNSGLIDIGIGAKAYGLNSKAIGPWSTADGQETFAIGNKSFAEGSKNIAYGNSAHVEGYQTIAEGQQAHAEGYKTEARGQRSHAEGESSVARGKYSHAEGYKTTTSADMAHAEGESSIASEKGSHAEGYKAQAKGQYSHAEGYLTIASRQGAHAEGYSTIASGQGAHAEGYSTTASGWVSHAEGSGTQATYDYGHAEGFSTHAAGTISHAEGYSTYAAGYAHAEGSESRAEGEASHAEGQSTTASGAKSHAEGTSTRAINNSAHAEGHSTTANGEQSHAEGYLTTASGSRAHAEGRETVASGDYSHASGYGTIASTTAQTVVGKFNAENNDALFIVGCGSSKDNRKNALEVTKSDEDIIVKVGETSLTENEFKQVKNIEDKANNSELAAVAKTGSYDDLTNKPAIPSIDGLASTTYVDNKVASIVESAPETLDTLNELAAALGDDPNFATTVANQLGNKLDKNDIPLSKGTGTKSLVLMDGKATGDYSFAGGSTDKSIAEEITGISMSLNPAEAKGVMSMAFGGNSTTYSPGALSFGANVSAGHMAYYFDSIDFTNKKITLSTTRRVSTLVNPSYPSSIEWVAGDVISIKNDANYVMCSKITNVSGNVITVDSLPFDKINYESVLSVFVYTLPHDRTVMNNTQPDKGAVALGFGAVSMGGGQSKNNAAQGMMSYAFGFENTAAGNFSIAVGRENTAGYGSAAFGYKNEAVGQCSTALGQQSKARSNNSIAFGNASETVSGNSAGALGQACKAGAIGAFAIGSNVYTNESNATSGIDTDATNYRGQIVVGRYNANPGYNTFVVGTGTASTAMNAFEVSNKFSTFNTPLQVKKLFGGKTPDTSYAGWMAFGHHDGTRHCFELSQGGNITTTGKASFGGAVTAINDFNITTSRNDTAGLAQSAGVTRLVCGKYADTSYTGSIVVGNGDSTTNKNSFTVSQGGNVTAEGWIKAGSLKIGDNTLNGTNLILKAKVENGDLVSATGYASHAEGCGGSVWSMDDDGDPNNGGATQEYFFNNQATGRGSHAEGHVTLASGDYSHAEGVGEAQGDFGGAWASYTEAKGEGSHAEGYSTTASGKCSHSQGSHTQALGDYSHAQGINSIASGQGSFASGYNAKAQADYSIAIGNNITNENPNSVMIGSDSYNMRIGYEGITANCPFYLNFGDSSMSINGGSTYIDQIAGDVGIHGYTGVSISSPSEIKLEQDNANIFLSNDIDITAGFGSINISSGHQLNLGKHGVVKDANGVTAIFAGKYPNTSYQGSFALGHYQSTEANPKNCFEVSQSGNVLATGWIKSEGQLQGASLKLGSTTITETQLKNLLSITNGEEVGF